MARARRPNAPAVIDGKVAYVPERPPQPPLSRPGQPVDPATGAPIKDPIDAWPDQVDHDKRIAAERRRNVRENLQHGISTDVPRQIAMSRQLVADTESDVKRLEAEMADLTGADRWSVDGRVWRRLQIARLLNLIDSTTFVVAEQKEALKAMKDQLAGL